MSFRVFVCALVAACLTGCASVQPVLAPTAAADPNAGYVAGLFTRMKSRGYAFVVRATEGGAEYVMPLGEDASLPKQVTDAHRAASESARRSTRPSDRHRTCFEGSS